MSWIFELPGHILGILVIGVLIALDAIRCDGGDDEY